MPTVEEVSNYVHVDNFKPYVNVSVVCPHCGKEIPIINSEQKIMIQTEEEKQKCRL